MESNLIYWTISKSVLKYNWKCWILYFCCLEETLFSFFRCKLQSCVINNRSLNIVLTLHLTLFWCFSVKNVTLTLGFYFCIFASFWSGKSVFFSADMKCRFIISKKCYWQTCDFWLLTSDCDVALFLSATWHGF